MNITQPVFQIGGIVGSVVVVYFAVRVVATICDPRVWRLALGRRLPEDLEE